MTRHTEATTQGDPLQSGHFLKFIISSLTLNSFGLHFFGWPGRPMTLNGGHGLDFFWLAGHPVALGFVLSLGDEALDGLVAHRALECQNLRGIGGEELLGLVRGRRRVSLSYLCRRGGMRPRRGGIFSVPVFENGSGSSLPPIVKQTNLSLIIVTNEGHFYPFHYRTH